MLVMVAKFSLSLSLSLTHTYSLTLSSLSLSLSLFDSLSLSLTLSSHLNTFSIKVMQYSHIRTFTQARTHQQTLKPGLKMAINIFSRRLSTKLQQ